MATQKYTRQTPRKVRLVANTVKKLPLEQALRQLSVMERRASLVVMKVVKQAMANAINNHGLKFDELVLSNILVTEGPRYRRFNAVSRGRAHGIIKRTSHICVTLMTKDDLKTKDAGVATPATAKVAEKTEVKEVAVVKSKKVTKTTAAKPKAPTAKAASTKTKKVSK